MYGSNLSPFRFSGAVGCCKSTRPGVGGPSYYWLESIGVSGLTRAVLVLVLLVLVLVLLVLVLVLWVVVVLVAAVV